MNKSDLIALRPGTEEDKNFIYSTWLKGLKFGNDWFKHIDTAAYNTNYVKVLNKLYYDPNALITVACLKTDPDVILGYSICRVTLDNKTLLDWVFVKTAWRKIGIARSLVPLHLDAITHLTIPGVHIWKAKFPNVPFNPFLT